MLSILIKVLGVSLSSQNGTIIMSSNETSELEVRAKTKFCYKNLSFNELTQLPNFSSTEPLHLFLEVWSSGRPKSELLGFADCGNLSTIKNKADVNWVELRNPIHNANTGKILAWINVADENKTEGTNTETNEISNITVDLDANKTNDQEYLIPSPLRRPNEDSELHIKSLVNENDTSSNTLYENSTNSAPVNENKVKSTTINIMKTNSTTTQAKTSTQTKKVQNISKAPIDKNKKGDVAQRPGSGIVKKDDIVNVLSGEINKITKTVQHTVKSSSSSIRPTSIKAASNVVEVKFKHPSRMGANFNKN